MSFALQNSNHDGRSHARSPPGGSTARSAIHDRAPPIKLLDPRTNRFVNVKPSRTAASAAPLQSGGTICREFLERTGCQAGSYCPSVHVLGREHMWESINASQSGTDGPYVAGFSINCYDSQMIKYLSIPSETVFPTNGSRNFIAMYNENGENFKARYQLCKNFHEANTCVAGTACGDIHTFLKDFKCLSAQETHVCDDDVLHMYPRLPADVVVRVYQQNSSDESNDYFGDQVLVTQGSQQYLDAYLADGKQIPRKKMQHCAHFRLKRLCRIGAGCKFIHVVSEALSKSPVDDDIDIALQSQTSNPRIESPRSGAESPLSEVNVIVRERPRGSHYRSPLSSDLSISPDSERVMHPKPKGMGPADVAAMLAVRMSSGQALPQAPQPTGMTQVANPCPPLVPPVDSARPSSVSPTRHNPYDPGASVSPSIQEPTFGSNPNQGHSSASQSQMQYLYPQHNLGQHQQQYFQPHPSYPQQQHQPQASYNSPPMHPQAQPFQNQQQYFAPQLPSSNQFVPQYPQMMAPQLPQQQQQQQQYYPPQAHVPQHNFGQFSSPAQGPGVRIGSSQFQPPMPPNQQYY